MIFQPFLAVSLDVATFNAVELLSRSAKIPLGITDTPSRVAAMNGPRSQGSGAAVVLAVLAKPFSRQLAEAEQVIRAGVSAGASRLLGSCSAARGGGRE